MKIVQKNSDKVWFHITRSRLESKETISSVQKCFDRAQSSLILKSIKIALRNFSLKRKNQIVSLIVIIITSIFINSIFKCNLIYSTLISLVASGKLFLTTVCLMFYFEWRNFIKETITNEDISYKLANSIYSKENNAFFIASPLNSNHEVIATAAILIDEEKNIYRDDLCPKFLNNQKEALIIRVTTLPEYQGKGTGKAVVQACIDFAKEKNVTNIKLVTDNSKVAALGLYKYLGFRITNNKECFPSIGFNKVLMELNLQ